MSSQTIVAEGVWCQECERFEVPDFTDGNHLRASTCMACGCRQDAHLDAIVVTT